MHPKYNNMHKNGMFYAWISISNYINMYKLHAICCPAHIKKHETDRLKYMKELCRFIGYPKDTVGYYFYCPEEQSIFFVKRVIFLRDEYLLRRESGSKVVLKEVLDQNTYAFLLDENLLLDKFQVHTKGPHMSERVPRQSD